MTPQEEKYLQEVEKRKKDTIRVIGIIIVSCVLLYGFYKVFQYGCIMFH